MAVVPVGKTVVSYQITIGMTKAQQERTNKPVAPKVFAGADTTLAADVRGLSLSLASLSILLRLLVLSSSDDDVLPPGLASFPPSPGIDTDTGSSLRKQKCLLASTKFTLNLLPNGSHLLRTAELLLALSPQRNKYNKHGVRLTRHCATDSTTTWPELAALSLLNLPASACRT